MLRELRRHAVSSAMLHKLATGEKIAGPVLRMMGRGAASAGAHMLAHPIVTGTVALGGVAAAQKARKTYAAMQPAAHQTMLGMNR